MHSLCPAGSLPTLGAEAFTVGVSFSSSLSDELLLLQLSGALVVTGALLCTAWLTAATARPGFPGPGSFCPALAGVTTDALGCCLFESTVLFAAEDAATLLPGAVGLTGECKELAALPLTTAGVTYRKQKKLEVYRKNEGLNWTQHYLKQQFCIWTSSNT